MNQHVNGSCFTCAPVDDLHPALAQYLHSKVAQSAHYNENSRCYKFCKNGIWLTCGGLHRTLKGIYYPHYKDNRSRRKGNVKIKGSSKKQGIRVDREVGMMVERARIKKMHPMTQRLLEFWNEMGEHLQASQVPVQLTLTKTKMTQADLITRDAQGRLILYELKTGAPVGFSVTQGTFSVKEAQHVKCTKQNIWQLQLAYTRMALQKAGIPIYESRVIQIFEKKGEGLQVKIYTPPVWTEKLPLNPVRCVVKPPPPLPKKTKRAPPKGTSLKKVVRKPPPLSHRQPPIRTVLQKKKK